MNLCSLFFFLIYCKSAVNLLCSIFDKLLEPPYKGGDGLKTPVKKSPAGHFFPEPTPSEPRKCSPSPVLSEKSPSASPERQHSESEAESLPDDAKEVQPEQSGDCGQI